MVNMKVKMFLNLNRWMKGFNNDIIIEEEEKN